MYQYTIFDILKEWAESELLAMQILRGSVCKSYVSFADRVLSANFGEVVSDFVHAAYVASGKVLTSLNFSVRSFSEMWGIDIPKIDEDDLLNYY